jgi:transcription antitermination factor NusG
MSDMNWYVVHTYSGYEKKVKDTIDQTIRNRKEHTAYRLDIRTHRSRTSDSGAFFCGMPRRTWRPEDSERQIVKRKVRPRLLTESDRKCRQP